MSKGWHEDWRNFDPTTRKLREEATAEAKKIWKFAATTGDRGTRRGAKRCVVDELFNLYDSSVAKAAGIKGINFQSRKEAKRYIGLAASMKAGHVRPSERFGPKWNQVRFNLHTRNPAGLIEKVAVYIADFVYDLRVPSTEVGVTFDWQLVVEDVKPSGGHREDTYLLKKRWFEAEYGLKINEF